jgi:hypothetical protein
MPKPKHVIDVQTLRFVNVSFNEVHFMRRELTHEIERSPSANF